MNPEAPDWLAESRALCRRAKYIGEDVIWRARDNHAGALFAYARILDQNRTTLTGLQFCGEVQRRRYGPYQKYSLMLDRKGRRLRVFTLEVMPAHVRSHIEPGKVLFGSHVQVGDEREEGLSHAARAVMTQLDAGSVNGWIGRFRRHARVYDGDACTLAPPFSDDLFGL